MFRKIANGCVKLIEKILPDAFIFALILTIVVFIFAMPAAGVGPWKVVQFWGNGAWSLLAFSMQMVLVLVLGNAFATAPLIKKGLQAIAKLPKGPFSAIVIVTAISTVCCWLNWGFGLVVGAILAKEIAKRRPDTDYRLLIASAYSGFVVWHGGLSGSIPLALASVTESVSLQTGGAVAVGDNIAVSTSILSGWNILICVAIFIFMPIVNALMHPSKEMTIAIDPALLVDEEGPAAPTGKKTFAQWVERTPILSIIAFALGLAYTIYYFANGGSLSLNSVNLIFLWLGIVFHGRPINYVHAINDAVKGAGGIILQFPFYAGIMGMMTGVGPTGTSLAGVISDFFVRISTTVTFPVWTFLSAGIVNFFVPSGGSQWTVQGPIVMPAAKALGVSPAVASMGIAWGDAWTNMLQPFWALPALGIAKLGARDIMGYCLVDLIITGIIITLGFLIVGWTGISAII